MRSLRSIQRRLVLVALTALTSLTLAPVLKAGFSGTDVFIPASARAAGAAPSQFYSTLWITNLSTSAATNAQLKFYQRDTSNTSPITVPVTIAPGETKKYENVVQTVFGLPSASGAIRIQADHEVLASSRTYNLPPGSDIRDANGLFFTGIPQSLAIGNGESSQLQGVSQNGSEDFRYNFGMVETAGSPVTVRINVRNSDGSEIGSKDYPVQAFEAKQFGVADAAPGISTVNGRIDASVIVGSGAVLLYGTAVANGSLDSIGFEMSYRNSLLSGGVSSLNGLTGAVSLAAGTNVTLTPSGNTITINATGDGGVAGVSGVNGYSGAVNIEAGTNVTLSAASAGNGFRINAANGGLTLPYSGAGIAAAPNSVFAVSNTGGGVAVSGVTVGTAGVYGQGGNRGVHGESSTNSSSMGVLGTSSTGYGVIGQNGISGTYDSNKRGGVWGDTVDGQGVLGTSKNSIGVSGVTSSKYGVQAVTAGGSSSYALAAFALGGGSQAGYFSGPVTVTGTLSKPSGSFKIDHPIEPETKYLYHSFVESPDMMNIYNGIAILDGRGEAAIALPDWFSTLNRDFRYQLTCIGGYSPVYISQEVSANSFRIAGGKPGLKVSWQVTGIRQDAWANAHRVPVEELKSETERGFYLHPEVFGQPEEKGLEWARNPDGMSALKQLRERTSQQVQ